MIRDAKRELSSTRVLPTADYPIDASTSLLWCSTMQLAWDELEQLLGGNVRAAETNPVVDALNTAPDARPDLDEPSYVALAGTGKDILERITQEMSRKFPQEQTLLPPANLREDEFLAYAYLFKNLEFAYPLMPRESAFSFNGQGSFAAFGLWKDSDRIDADRRERWNQVKVLHYHAPDDWSIQIEHKNPGDRLIIARSPLQPTLGQTLARVINQPLNDNAPYLKSDERLIVPRIDFDITRDFDELADVELRGEGFPPVIVRQAIQTIQFRLDERGAVLKSRAQIKGDVMSAPVPDKPREFVCDGPFFVIMMRDDAARPYFAAYIANDELLLPFTK